jgi:hypothetical protein
MNFFGIIQSMTILSFSFSNFDAFKEEAHVDLRLSSRDAAQGWTRNTLSGKRFTTLLAAVGANAAGKTSVLRALAFVLRFMRSSFHDPVNSGLQFTPFGVFGEDALRSSTFQIEFEDTEGVYWVYGLECKRWGVISERLRKREPGASLKHVFVRELKGDEKSFDSVEAMLTASTDEFFPTYAITQGDLPAKLPANALTHMRANVSLISFARQFGVNVIQECLLECPLVDSLALESRASNLESVTDAARHLHKNPKMLDEVTNHLRRWDLGLSSIDIVELDKPKDPALAAAHVPKLVAMGLHKAGRHKFALLFEQESSGTRAAFVLLRHILQALHGGGVALIDEFDATLHPHMIEPILRMFSDETTNPHGAQLICTLQNTHAMSLLAPAQVLFVEKVDGESSVYRGDQVRGLKAEHNLERKYLSGALGAVPQL